MVNAKWGLKRTCQSCGAKFYDLSKSPILCPKCGVTFDPEALLKARRSRPVAAKPAPVEEADTVEAEVVVEGDEKEEEEEAVMEDTSELGQDSDDVEEVVDKDGAAEER